MKTNKILSIIAIFFLIFSSVNITLAQSSNWWWDSWWSSTSWSDSTWSTSTGGDNSWSDSTWWDETGWDSSWSDSEWTDTWWDSSWSDYTWSDSTWWENSGSDNTTWNETEWDLIKNMYWEIIQLKARISKESINYANRMMNNFMLANNSWTNEEKKFRYQKLLNNVNDVIDNQKEWKIKDSLEYLKLRLEYRISIFEWYWELEKKMNSMEIHNIERVMSLFRIKYEKYVNEYRQEQYEKLLWKVYEYQNRIGSLNFDEAKKEKAQNTLRYMEMKINSELDLLGNE